MLRGQIISYSSHKKKKEQEEKISLEENMKELEIINPNNPTPLTLSDVDWIPVEQIHKQEDYINYYTLRSNCPPITYACMTITNPSNIPNERPDQYQINQCSTTACYYNSPMCDRWSHLDYISDHIFKLAFFIHCVIRQFALHIVYIVNDNVAI